ncbi:MAG: hypothetical protein V1922_00780 [bacterium]
MAERPRPSQTPLGPVAIDGGPLRPFHILRKERNRFVVSDGKTKAKSLPKANVMSFDELAQVNAWRKEHGKRPTQSLSTVAKDHARMQGKPIDEAPPTSDVWDYLFGGSDSMSWSERKGIRDMSAADLVRMINNSYTAVLEIDPSRVFGMNYPHKVNTVVGMWSEAETPEMVHRNRMILLDQFATGDIPNDVPIATATESPQVESIKRESNYTVMFETTFSRDELIGSLDHYRDLCAVGDRKSQMAARRIISALNLKTSLTRHNQTVVETNDPLRRELAAQLISFVPLLTDAASRTAIADIVFNMTPAGKENEIPLVLSVLGLNSISDSYNHTVERASAQVWNALKSPEPTSHFVLRRVARAIPTTHEWSYFWHTFMAHIGAAVVDRPEYVRLLTEKMGEAGSHAASAYGSLCVGLNTILAVNPELMAEDAIAFALVKNTLTHYLKTKLDANTEYHRTRMLTLVRTLCLTHPGLITPDNRLYQAMLRQKHYDHSFGGIESELSVVEDIQALIEGSAA